MIITAQPFFNELDLLEIKFRELAGVVDAHLVVESPLTFTGIPKPLHFHENRRRFSEFPVIYRVLELPTDAISPWDREWLTYETILQEVRKINPEIAIWCDTDEIPRRNTVERFREMKVKTAHVDMDCLLFYFDRLDLRHRATTAKIGYWDPLCAHQPWRGETHHPILPDAGWHFQYTMFGGVGHLIDKLAATSHAPEDTGEGLRSRLVRGEKPENQDPGKTAAYALEKLPAFIQANRDRFAGQFAP